MRAGTLRKRVTIQQPIEGSADELNEKPMTWGDVTTVWAAVLPQSGREFYRAQQVHAELTHVVSIRWRPGLGPRLRLVLNGRPLNVLAIVNVGERKEELLLYCVEEVEG